MHSNMVIFVHPEIATGKKKTPTWKERCFWNEVYFGNFGSDALQLVIFGNGEKDVVYFAHDSARHVFLLRHWGVGGHLDEHSEIVCGVCF